MSAPTAAAAAAPAGPPLDQEPLGARWARRAVTLPGCSLLLALWLASAPVALPLALVLDVLLRRRLASARFVLALGLMLVAEQVGLLSALALWLARPTTDRAGDLRRNARLQAAWAHALFAGAARLYRLRLEVEGAEALGAPGPLLVLVRHASLADTLLPVLLLAGAGRRRRYVLKRELLWDPCLDVVGNRLPNVFVRRGEGAAEAARVGALARDLAPDEAVVIFPAGARFTPARRARVLAALADAHGPGSTEHTAAASLGRVLPPRPGGALALLEAAPTADVVVIAHTGLEPATSLADLWRGALLGGVVRVHVTRAAAAALPASAADRVAWLQARWREVDTWVAAHERPAPP